jgi:hypothetical protein
MVHGESGGVHPVVAEIDAVIAAEKLAHGSMPGINYMASIGRELSMLPSGEIVYTFKSNICWRAGAVHITIGGVGGPAGVWMVDAVPERDIHRAIREYLFRCERCPGG